MSDDDGERVTSVIIQKVKNPYERIFRISHTSSRIEFLKISKASQHINYK